MSYNIDNLESLTNETHTDTQKSGITNFFWGEVPHLKAHFSCNVDVIIGGIYIINKGEVMWNKLL